MQVYVQHLGDQVRSSLVTAMEGERWRRGTVAGPALASWHPAIRDTFSLDTDTGYLGHIRVTSGDMGHLRLRPVRGHAPLLHQRLLQAGGPNTSGETK